MEIIDDIQFEADKPFYVKLSLLGGARAKHLYPTVLGRISIMEVTILNDDGLRPQRFKKPVYFTLPMNNFPIDPGTISFEERGILVKESVGKAQVAVVRKHGADGEVSVRWQTVGKYFLKMRRKLKNDFNYLFNA